MLRACLAAVAALLLLACTARAQSETVNFASLVGPDFSSRSLLAQFMPRPVGATAGGNAVIQPITLTPPSCPAGAFKCYNLTNSALTSYVFLFIAMISARFFPPPTPRAPAAWALL